MLMRLLRSRANLGVNPRFHPDQLFSSPAPPRHAIFRTQVPSAHSSPVTRQQSAFKMRSPLAIAFLLLLCLIPLLPAQILAEEIRLDDPLIQARSNVSIEYLSLPATAIVPASIVGGHGLEGIY